jgi:hypothetical protein
MGFLTKILKSGQRSYKKAQRANAAQQRANAAQQRAAVKQQAAAAGVAACNEARRVSPYYRDAAVSPGQRIPTVESWPDAPDSMDGDVLSSWDRKCKASDRRLGLWSGDYETSVAGSSFYEPAFDWLWEGIDGGDCSVTAVAELVPEPENPYDDNAVKVMVGPIQIGHLPADDAEGLVGKIKRRTTSGKPTWIRIELARNDADILGIPEPADPD